MKKRILCLLLAACLLAAGSSLTTVSGAGFPDVDQSFWAYAAILEMESRGVVNGYTDGTFRPANPVSRAEFAKMLTGAAGLRPEYPETPTFRDVPASDWAYGYIEAVKENMPSYFDGIAWSFEPAEGARREDVAAAIVSMKGYDFSAEDVLDFYGKFTDTESVSLVNVPLVAIAVREGIFTGYPDGTFQGQGTITRAEIAAVLNRVFPAAGGEPEPTPEPTPVPTPEPTPAPTPTPVLAQTEEKSLHVGSSVYWLGMTEAELTEEAGQPEERQPTVAGYEWYIYGTDSYSDFFMAGVYDSQVVALASGGNAFRYMGCGAGDTNVQVNSAYAELFTDKNDNGILHAVLLKERALQLRGSDNSAAALYGESRAIFHMTNAFRAYHGLSALQWSDAAAEAARLHSQDMADQNYFEHDSLDGRSPWDRMEAQGIVSYSSAAENISAGRNGVDAYDGWVNSGGHRSNMLGDFMYLGVGSAYAVGSTYRYYATQDFFSTW